MFRTAKIVASLKSDWEYTVTEDDSRQLDYLLKMHAGIRRLPATAAAGMFLCHMMKRDYEFTSLYFPDVLIKILNLPDQHPDRLSRSDAGTLLEAATAALIRHQHKRVPRFRRLFHCRTDSHGKIRLHKCDL